MTMERPNNSLEALRARNQNGKPEKVLVNEALTQLAATQSDARGQIPFEARNIDRNSGSYSIDSAGNSVFTYTKGDRAGMQIVMRPDGKGEVRHPRDLQTGEQRVEYFGPSANNNFVAYNKHSSDGGWFYRYESGAQAYRSADGRSGFDQVPAANGRWTRTCWGPNPEDNYTINGSHKGMYDWKFTLKYPDRTRFWADETGSWNIDRTDGTEGRHYYDSVFGSDDIKEGYWQGSSLSRKHRGLYRGNGTIA